ncbi:MAG TPA: hypothetical protein VNO79_12515 [Actinomycetota bacterium]|nr:hypothetical protein [Actinomycetota bacterium]
MGRKILFEREGQAAILEEVDAPEADLQEVVKENPELLPIEDFAMAGPLLVIGRETPLPSGAVDLVALSRAGDLLLVEFKVGPANPDFRRATSQLLDYGSDLWERSVEGLERSVALPYFQGPRCPQGSPGHGARSLEEAARRAWPDASDEDLDACLDHLGAALASGGLHYVVAAQQFTEPALRTIAYLDAISRASFYAVELVRFAGPAGVATEARTVYRPEPRRAGPVAPIDEAAFLEHVDDPAFRASLERVLEEARNLGYRIEWGVRGGAIKLPAPDHPDPLSVGWIFDDGAGNWSGLRNLTLGYQPRSLELRASVRGAIARYEETLAALPGAKPVVTSNEDLRGYELDRNALPPNETAVIACLAQLAHDAQEGGSAEG